MSNLHRNTGHILFLLRCDCSLFSPERQLCIVGPPSILFNAPPPLWGQGITAYQSNQTNGTAHTNDRSQIDDAALNRPLRQKTDGYRFVRRCQAV